MTAAAVTTAIACLGIGACGYLIGRIHARESEQRKRPGYVVGPFVDPPEWDFPAAPAHGWGMPVDVEAAMLAAAMAATREALRR